MSKLLTVNILDRKEKIMAEWVEKSLGEIAEVTKLAGFEFTKYIKYNDDGEIIALRALNLRHGEIDLTDIKRISREVSDGLTRSKIYKDDILLTYTGNGYGDCAIIEENDKYHLAPNICKIVPNTEAVFPYYLYCYIRSKAFYNQMSNNMTGSGQPTIPMKTIRLLKIPIPEMDVQVNIANMIWSLNQKIRNNKAINNNLEQQAQTIFDSMFSNISNGENTIGDTIRPKRGKGLLSKNAAFGNVPVVAGGLEPSTYHNTANTKAPVLAISASGANAGFVSLWNMPIWSSDSSFIDSSMTDDVYFWYVLLKKRQREIYDSQTGSAQPHIYPQHIAAMPISDLNFDDVRNYTSIVTPIFEMIGHNKYENAQLTTTRDALLPKLMSGELDVSDIKI